MTQFGRFFLPGPTEVRPEVLHAMAQPTMGHRGPELESLLRGDDPVLREVFGTERPVYVATASATAMMEAAVRCGVRHRALSLVNGAFSDRFAALIGDCGRKGESYQVEWGEAHQPDRLYDRLVAGEFDAVTVVHSETSTGVLDPLPQLADAVRAAEEETGREILLLVDGVTSVGGMEMALDEWGLDLLLTGSQKALALPPGLAFAAASPRLLQRAATLAGRGQYLDLLEYDKYWQRHQTPTTPAVNLIYALHEQLGYIRQEGIEHRAARHAAMRERCCDWVGGEGARWQLSVLAPEAHRSPTVTTIQLPPSLHGERVVDGMRARGFVIGGGYGKLKASTIRIGHMGDHTVAELDEVLATLDAVLRKL